MPLRHTHDGSCEIEFGRAVYVIHAPISAHRAFRLSFPRLIKRLHQVIHQAVAFGARDETAQEQSLLGVRTDAAARPADGTWPAYLAEDDRWARAGRSHHARTVERGGKSLPRQTGHRRRGGLAK